MDHYAGMQANGSLLGKPLNGNSLEVGSSGNVVLYRDDNGNDEEEDKCLEKDDEDNIQNEDGDRILMQQQQQINHIEQGLYVEDANYGDGGCTIKRKRRRGPKLWRDKWQRLHPWAFIRNMNGEERMFCTVCEMHGHRTTRNAFRKEGSTNFQQSALATHANSSAHKSALLIQKSQAESGKMCLNGKTCGKAFPVPEHGTLTNYLAKISDKLSSLVTREDLESLKAELRLMICCQDARRINARCALNDPLIPVPTANGTYPENLPPCLSDLIKLPNGHVNALLMAYGLPTHGQLDAKVRRLKAHLGFQ